MRESSSEDCTYLISSTFKLSSILLLFHFSIRLFPLPFFSSSLVLFILLLFHYSTTHTNASSTATKNKSIYNTSIHSLLSLSSSESFEARARQSKHPSFHSTGYCTPHLLPRRTTLYSQQPLHLRTMNLLPRPRTSTTICQWHATLILPRRKMQVETKAGQVIRLTWQNCLEQRCSYKEHKPRRQTTLHRRDQKSQIAELSLAKLQQLQKAKDEENALLRRYQRVSMAIQTIGILVFEYDWFF